MDLILKTIDEALKKKGLSDAAASKLAVGHTALLKNLRTPRKGEKRYNLPALQKLAEVLDLELYFGPPRNTPQSDFNFHMTHFDYDLVREKVESAIEEFGLRPLSKRLGVPVGILRSASQGREIGVSNLVTLCDRLGLDLSLGEVDSPTSPTSFSDNMLPHHGLAKCGVTGWGKDQPDMPALPAPEFINDPSAFYVSASGQSMIPEGIQGGDLCLVSPVQDIRNGDRIWIKDGHGKTAIKRLIEIDGSSLNLRGWMPVEDGQQKSFDENRSSKFIAAAHPVVAVFRGKPGGDNVRFIPDPKRSQQPVITNAPADDLHLVRIIDAQADDIADGPSWQDRAVTSLAFPKSWLRQFGVHTAAAALAISRDDDMAPTIAAGSTVLIDRNRRSPKDKKIYAILRDGKTILRRVACLENDQLLLLGDNPDSAPIPVTDTDPKPEVLGEVVWISHGLT